MKEDFLHYLWKFQKFDSPSSLHTSEGQKLQVINCGSHNTENSGPDFFNAQLIIDDQKWAGNVEIHVKSSDWYAHNHQNDTAYDSVVLHVVWEHDIEVYRSKNTLIPTLELQNITPSNTLKQYQNLLNNTAKPINCAGQLKKVSLFTVNNWIERLFVERLHAKSNRIAKLFNQLNKNWEATCFCLIAQYFGGNKNGIHFQKIALSIPFHVLQKTTSYIQIEALLFGQANLLEQTLNDAYYLKLQQEYQYLKHKYQLKKLEGLTLEFFRLRPTNFPTIRLAQLAQLFIRHKQLFSLISSTFEPLPLKALFKNSTSAYWETHYSFGKESNVFIKKTSNAFIELLIINAIIPLQYHYAKSLNKDINVELLQLISALKPEKNAITALFAKENLLVKNALHSQATIQLKKEYCDANLCLKCAIGFELLKAK